MYGPPIFVNEYIMKVFQAKIATGIHRQILRRGNAPPKMTCLSKLKLTVLVFGKLLFLAAFKAKYIF